MFMKIYNFQQKKKIVMALQNLKIFVHKLNQVHNYIYMRFKNIDRKEISHCKQLWERIAQKMYSKSNKILVKQIKYAYEICSQIGNFLLNVIILNDFKDSNHKTMYYIFERYYRVAFMVCTKKFMLRCHVCNDFIDLGILLCSCSKIICSTE